MEDAMAFNTTVNASASLPDLAVIFIPVLLIQLLIGLVSNLLLIALLVKASSVNGQNNTNIYLYSMAVNNIISMFPALTLLISTLAKEWVLGQNVCSLNQFVTYMVGVPYFYLNACISREKYKAVLQFYKWKPYSKKTYIIVAFIWISALCGGIIGPAQGGQLVGKTDSVLSCYYSNRWYGERRLLPLVSYLVVMWIIFVTVLSFTIVHYAYTFKALNAIKKARTLPNTQETKHDHMGTIPISWEAEVRSLKSMACVFFVSIAPHSFGILYYTVVTVLVVLRRKSFEEVNVPILTVTLSVCTYSLPTASPLLLIAINKRFRMRMKHLFRWQLKPTDVASNSDTTIAELKRKKSVLEPQSKPAASRGINNVTK